MNASGNTPPSPPSKRRGRRLARLANVRTGLADVIRGLESGEIPPKLGNALVYAYAALASVMAGAELEDRVARIETELRRRNHHERRLAS